MIVLAIPVIIIAGLLFFVVSEIFKIGGDSVDREACRNSVLLKERSKVLGEPLISDVRCETNLVEVDSTDQDIVFHEITNEMYDCWYQFGEGKRDFLSDYDFAGSNEWCFVCSRIDFSEDVKEEYPKINMDDFNSFLTNEVIPLSSRDTTFYEYFYGSDLPNQIGGDFQDTSSFFDTNEPLYVGFLIDKSRKYNAAFWTELGIGVGSVVICGAAIYGSGGFATPLAASLCTRGALALTSSVVMMSTVKEGYISGMNIGSGDIVKEWCNMESKSDNFVPGGGQSGGGGASGDF